MKYIYIVVVKCRPELGEKLMKSFLDVGKYTLCSCITRNHRGCDDDYGEEEKLTWTKTDYPYIVVYNFLTNRKTPQAHRGRYKPTHEKREIYTYCHPVRSSLPSCQLEQLTQRVACTNTTYRSGYRLTHREAGRGSTNLITNELLTVPAPNSRFDNTIVGDPRVDVRDGVQR